MGIKSFFGENNLGKDHAGNTVVPLTSLSGVAVSSSVESPRLMRAVKVANERFIPQIDFSKPENFAVYGSAAEYYKNSVKHIYGSYPYDGSAAEKQEWHNSASYWENYIFENEYPRTNGYAKFSPQGWGTISGSAVYGYALSNQVEYIKVFGGPNTSDRKYGDSITGSLSPGDYKDGFANIFDEDSNRGSNLQFGHAAGNTIEFWMKKSAHVSAVESNAKREVLFDAWNKVDYAVTPKMYGRLTLEMTTGSSTGDTASPIELTLISGTYGFTRQKVGAGLTRATVYDGNWHHYAITMKTSSVVADDEMKVEVFVDGTWKSSHGLGTRITSSVGLPHVAYIGALQAPPSGATAMTHRGGPSTEADGSGYGKFSGSIDELRFWKRARTAQDIGRFWFTPVHGATNDDRSNSADLGIYYKFNEGIVGTSALDSIVLDYSGRVSNGEWVATGSSGIAFLGSTYRSTDSAIVQASASAYERKDPILRPSHTSIQTYLTASAYSSSFYDDQNGNMIYHQLPSWITEEDYNSGGELKKICQIMGSYLDTVNLQIQTLPKIKHISYSEDVSGSKPYPFMKGMLYGMGFKAPDLFTETTALQRYMDRDERILYEEKLNDIKNLIYRNIYNNLTYIYKTKGTEKSLRNLIRCFGVDDEIYKLNFYGQNVVYDFEDRYRSTSVKRNYINFYDTTWPSPSAYNKTEAVVYMGGTEIADCMRGVDGGSGLGMTFECETKFPRKIRLDEDIFVQFPDLSASVFGMKNVDSTFTDSMTEQGDTQFSVYAVKQGREFGGDNTHRESIDAKFVCKFGDDTVLTSNPYKDVYNNEQWSFSVKVEPTKLASMFTSSAKNQTGVVTFTGINTAGDHIANKFVLTGSLTESELTTFLEAHKRTWMGAQRQNFTASLQYRSDIRVASMRGWLGGLTQKELEAHAKDVTNHGREQPLRNSFLIQTSGNQNYIPNIETLIYHWDFSSNTTASAGGELTVHDVSSGSFYTNNYEGTEGILSSDTFGDSAATEHLDILLSRKFPAKGYNFKPSTQVIDRDYQLSAKHQLPEIVNSSDQIQILDQDDIHFTRRTRPTNMVGYLEKSMYQVVSDDMINMFAGIAEFNNLIGAPIHKYRQEYKGLNLLRRIYFNKVGNTPDVEKFINYYRWIDDSVSQVLRQILPMSADVSGRVSNIVESHVLERNKYWNKFPTMEFKQDDPEGQIRGINELRYPWKYGHAAVEEENYYSLQKPKLVETWRGRTDLSIGTGPKWEKNNNSMVVQKNGTEGGLIHGQYMFFIRGEHGPSTGGQLKSVDKIAGPFILNTRVGSWTGADAFYQSGSTSNTVTIDIAESGDRLRLEYSADGASWTEFGTYKLHGSAGGIFSSTLMMYSLTASYAGTDDVYIRFNQPSSHANAAYDHFAIDAITIRPPNVHTYWNKHRKVRTDEPESAVNTARESIRQIVTTRTTGSAPLLSSSEYTSYRGSTYALRNFAQTCRFTVDEPSLPIGSAADKRQELGGVSKVFNKHNPSSIFGYHRGHLRPHNSQSFIEIDYHQDPDWRVFEQAPEDLSGFDRRVNTRAKLHPNSGQASWTPEKSMRVLPFTVYSNSVGSGYTAQYRVHGTSSLDFNNLHHDHGGHPLWDGTPLQGPFSEMYVGGLQYRHQDVALLSASTKYNRAEGWHITTPGTDGLDFHEILSQSWEGGASGWAAIQEAGLTHHAWRPGSGSTQTQGTGPSEAKDGTKTVTFGTGTGEYLYYETSASNAYGLGVVANLYTPVLNLQDMGIPAGLQTTGSFYYHMHGQDCGKLSLQFQTTPMEELIAHAEAGTEVLPDASGSWTDIEVYWDGAPATYIFGEQHAAANTAWSKAWFDLSPLLVGDAGFVRWQYEPQATILGEVAIDKIRLVGYDIADFRLFSGDYGNKREFSMAPYYRDEVAKRPLNIKNIQQKTGSTIIGNYTHPYEIVQTSDRSINNIWFRRQAGHFPGAAYKNAMLGQGVYRNFVTSSFVRQGLVTLEEGLPSASFHFDIGARSWVTDDVVNGSHQQTLSQRTGSTYYGAAVPTYLSGVICKNVIAEQFSAPGDKYTSPRRVREAFSEQFAPNNALPWRNIVPRTVHQKELARHTSKGGFGNEGLKWAGYLDGEAATATESKKHWVLGVSASQTGTGEKFASGSSSDFESLDMDADGTLRTYSFFYKGENLYDARKPLDIFYGGQRTLFSKGTQVSFDVTSTYASIYIASASPVNITGFGTKLFDGDWHHIAIALSGNTDASTCFFSTYLDGEHFASQLVAANNAAQDVKFCIGGVNLAPNRAFAQYAARGWFSEFAIYGKDLNAEQVREVYNNGKGADLFKHRNAQDLLHYYRFEDDTPVLKDWVAERKRVLRGHGTKGGVGQAGLINATAGIPISASINKSHRNLKASVKFRHATSSLAATLTSSQGVALASSPSNWSIESDYDNEYITSVIPRSDSQYSWIRKSLQYDSDQGHGYGQIEHPFAVHHSVSHGQGNVYAWQGALGYATSSAILRFCSQSHLYGSSSGDGAPQYQDFVGTNALLTDNMSINSGTYYVINLLEGPANSGFAMTGSDRGRYDMRVTGSQVLNALLLKRNGPFGYPSWKQIRGGEHPIARQKRRKNMIDFVYEKGVKVGDSGPHLKMKKTEYYFALSESAVIGKYRPLSTLISVGPTRDRVALRHSYGNNLSTFSNNFLNSLLNFERDEEQIHDQLHSLYSDIENKPESPINALLKFKYREVIFPSEKNMYRAQVRGRLEFTSFQENDAAFNNSGRESWMDQKYKTFWRRDITHRTRTSYGYGDVATDYFGGSTQFSASGLWRDRTSAWSTDVSQFSNGSRLSQYEPGDGTGDYSDTSTTTFKNLIVGQLIDPACVTTIDGTVFDSYLSPAECTGTAHAFAYVNTVQSTCSYGLRELSLFDQAENEIWEALGATGDLPGRLQTPMYDSYEEWSGDIRYLAKDYSIIPEFRVSDHMDYYINEKNGDFFARNRACFAIEGASEYTASALSGPESSATTWQFYADYSNSDFMKHFDVLVDSHDGIAETETISLTCRGVKKLLPYHGFYPQDRVAQLAQIFSSSMSSTSGSLAGDVVYTSQAQTGRAGFYKRLNSVMLPLFSPGVFFNSMKAGIAVDFPVYTGSVTSRTDPYFKTKPSFRMPFEASVDMVRYFPKMGFSTIARTGKKGTIYNHNFTGSIQHFGGWTGVSDPRFEMASHNFMGEIPKFFLRNEGVSVFTSEKAQDQKPMMSGSTYYMDVCLYQTSDMVTTEGPRKNSQTLGMRGHVYGPALSGCVSQSNATVLGSRDGSIYSVEFPAIGWRPDSTVTNICITDPNYCAWTPPYFYGKSIARIKFKPDNASVMDTDSSQVFEMSEILAHCDVEYRNDNPLKQIADRDEGHTDHLLSASWMPITASINLFDHEKIPMMELDPMTGMPTKMVQNSFEGQDVWKISTKWECPVLDYSNGDQHSGSWSGTTYSSGLTASATIDRTGVRGLWNTYGVVPTGSKGVWFSIEESYPEEVLKHGVRNRSSGVTGSLINFVGMKTGKQKIGDIAYQREFEEAVCVVPYLEPGTVAGDVALKKRTLWEPNTKRYFFRIDKLRSYLQQLHKQQTGKALPENINYPGSPEVEDTCITDLYSKMEKYVIPPPMDFTKNKEIDPFVMYMFEFSTVLTRRDLAKMWQGILPDAGIRSEMEEVTISHKNSINEFFSGEGLPPNIRWMVFKVKKRAESSYYNVAISPSKKIEQKMMNSFTFGKNAFKEPEYTYNWPYDFCSLVELVQLESEVVLEGTQEPEPPAPDPATPRIPTAANRGGGR